MRISALLSYAGQMQIELLVKQGKLVAKGEPEAVANILPLVRMHKQDLLEHFRQGSNHQPLNLEAALIASPMNEDWGHTFNERAAIIEFDGGLSREMAERCALVDLDQNSMNSTKGV